VNLGSLNFAYRDLCKRVETALNSRSPIPLPAGTVEGIITSAGLSFAANLIFSRGSLRISLQGGGAGVLAKLIQLTLLVGQHYFSRAAAPAVPPTYPFSPHSSFMTAQLVMFCFRKITSPSIDPWASVCAIWTNIPNANINYESLALICILKGKKA
jgi:hypothetical protein